jgi:hypothetical protein
MATFLAGPLTAAEPGKQAAPIFAAVRAALAKGEVQKTDLRGFALTKEAFHELPREGALLVGFDVGVGKFIAIENIYALRPVYRTAGGETIYGEHGLFEDQPGQKKSKVLRTVQLRAPEGYAVGSVTLRTGLNINGLSLTYLRINGSTLDPSQAYASEWVGDRTGGTESTISGDGAPVVGVFGKKDDVHVSALGLFCLAERAEPEQVWKSVTQGGQRPGSGGEAPPPPSERETYRDAEHHFSFDLPPGWSKMSRTELNKIDEMLRQRGLSDLVHYDTGFRRIGTALGEYPYILLQVQSLKTAGLTYTEIQRSLNLGLDGPMKTAQGAFSDIVRSASPGTATLDRARDRIIIRLQMDLAFVGKIDGLSVCHLGSDAVATVHAYAKESTFANNLRLFQDVDTSFEFDDGYRFVPAKEKEAVASLLPLFAFMGVAVPLGAVFLAFAAWKRRAPSK